MKKLLVVELKGCSFCLIDLESKNVYRARKKDFKTLLVGSLFEVENIKIYDDLILSFDVVSEVVGDKKKPRTKVCLDDINLGDLVDGVPVLSFGAVWVEKGKWMTYAYFKYGV